MYRDKRIVAWIPYGRKRTVEILIKYLLLDSVIDEIWLCMNTDPEQTQDRQYACELAEEHPRVLLKRCPGPDTPELAIPDAWRRGYRNPKQLNTARFYLYLQDPDIIGLRFDDDIVWVHPETPRKLADRVLDRHDGLAVMALIYNNAISSWLLQQHGRLPLEWGEIGHRVTNPVLVSAVDRVGWEDVEFATKLHELVLSHLEAGRDDDLRLDAELTLGRSQQYSISCFGISGGECKALDGILGRTEEEEHSLTMYHPDRIDKSNIVCGMAPVAHYSFYTQRALDDTDILERYGEVADRKWRSEMLGRRYYERMAET